MSLNIILTDFPAHRADLLPIAFTRPIADFRVGITTIRQKWETFLPGVYSYSTRDYLAPIYPMIPEADSLFIGGHLLPDEALVEAILRLPYGFALYAADDCLAFRGAPADLQSTFIHGRGYPAGHPRRIDYSGEPVAINFVYDIFLLNGKALVDDYRRIVAGRESQPLSPTNTLVGNPQLPDGTPAVFIEEGAGVEGAILNVKNGPIYIGKNAEIMEGVCVRGPLALCDNSHINMGAKIYGATTIGPVCKVGGEIQNSVIFGYSNKAHDGFLGNAVVGEWCNIGAGVNASNLKNDYSRIRLWNYPRHSFMRTNLQFCGLIMADHTKIGVNCMLNTATVLGVGVNIHGSGFPRVFVPSFSEGSPVGGFTDVSLSKFFDIANKAMARRGLTLSPQQKVMFQRIFEQAAQYK